MRPSRVVGGLVVAVAMSACVGAYQFASEGVDAGSTSHDASAPPSPDAGGSPMTDAPLPPNDGPQGLDVDGGGPFFVEAGTPGCWEITRPPDQGAAHIPEGTLFPWDSDPPASGSHYPVWAQFQEYTFPVPYGYVVHDMEHGAVVFFYRCPAGAPCSGVQAALRTASDSLPDDPLCTAPDGGGQNPGVRVRTVMLPSESMSVMIAASAWDWQYRANCIDQTSLNAFAAAHYGLGPETQCAPGYTAFVDAGGN